MKKEQQQQQKQQQKPQFVDDWLNTYVQQIKENGTFLINY